MHFPLAIYACAVLCLVDALVFSTEDINTMPFTTLLSARIAEWEKGIVFMSSSSEEGGWVEVGQW